METAELAMISSLDAGHLAPFVELGKTITTRDHRVSVTIFITESPFQSKLTPYTQTLLSNQAPPHMRFVNLASDEPTFAKFSRVKDFYSSGSANKPKGIILDMFCSAFAELASELAVPSYIFYTSNACSLSLMSYLQFLHDEKSKDISEFKDLETELLIPGFVNPVPAKVIPSPALDKELWSAIFVRIPRTIRKSKGILVNTIVELESYTIKCLSEDGGFPPIYPIGPVLNITAGASSNGNKLGEYEEIMRWLDIQPSASVIFLCFGSLGMFEAEQVVEIAHALEQSAHRFLWALRRPPTKDGTEPHLESDYFNEVLPEGFLERTKGVGKVIGWAPQVAVLSHQAMGGFVSHCGWNSILESLWCGVPIATWPLYAEQQMNAFELVKELGLAVEIKIDYQQDDPITLSADEIKRGIKELMEGTESAKIKSKVKAMSDGIRGATVQGGSSYAALGEFIHEVLNS